MITTQRQAAGHMKTKTESKFKCTYSEHVAAAVMRSSISRQPQRRRALALFYSVCMYFNSLSDTSRTLYKSAYHFDVALKFLALILVFYLSPPFSLCRFITVSVKGQASVRRCSNLCLTFSQILPLSASFAPYFWLSRPLPLAIDIAS